MDRIQKVLSNYGYCSRRRAEELLREGLIKVNGRVLHEVGYMVKKNDVIEVEGNIISREVNYEYYLLNKPRGVISSYKDEFGRKTVVDMIDTSSRIYPIGRLDYDTTGLILLTNDGRLANGLMHPSSGVDKTYIVKINGIITPKELMILKNGVVVDGVKYGKAIVKVKKTNKKLNSSVIEVTIHEGKNHQVKKMFEVLGYKVVKLRREKYAFLTLEGLHVGEYRKLTNKEVAILHSICYNK